ncbi:MAG TPA: NAD-dependent epimerase/dehydratase family protein [Candidatus Dormibacteraeota bacterium]|nr:NAD-dependent epimerase/dehydratase family protein [Candidatus Dormibacteraeota bacterium]
MVDTSGFVPRVVRQSAELLRGSAGVYAFVSTGSVYPLDGHDRSETGPVIRLDDPSTEDVTAAYGGLKALCEEVVTGVYGHAGLVVRSGLIVGPHDPTGRFTYWVTRLDRGREVLAPGAPDRQVQFIDARDQAEWILDMVEAGRGGTFNVTGPAGPLAMGELLARCGLAPLTWVADEFLLEHRVQPYSELPLWVPPSLGSLGMPIDRALAAGLRFRDLDATIRDTRAWAASGVSPAAVDAGGRLRRPAQLSAEREAELLRAWDGRRA